MKKINYKKEYKAKFLGMNSNTWLCIGILITIILVIFGIQSYLNSPKFYVLKTECYNETFVEDVPIPLHLLCAFKDAKDLDCMKNLMDACERFGGELWKDKNFAFTGYCIMKDVEQQRKICKEIKVNEIIISKPEWDCRDAFRYCSDDCSLLRGHTRDNEMADKCISNCENEFCVHPSISISKEDLTEDLLVNNNYECNQWCDYELYRKPLCFNSIEESWKDRDNIDNLLCSKYIFGDYRVELK